MNLSNIQKHVNTIKKHLLGLSLLNKIIVIIILLAVGYFTYTQYFQKSRTAQQYTTATVDKGSIITTVAESGNITSSQTTVTSPTNGVVTQVYVKNGDIVVPGQILFTVRSTATPQEQASAYASYLSAQNSLNSAQAKLNSLQSTLFKANQAFVNDKGTQNPTTDDPKYIEERGDWLQAEADYKNQTGVIAQSQAALNAASLAYQATQNAVVTAPIGGTIANLSILPGSSVTASSGNNNSSTTTTASQVLIIGDPTNLQVKVTVSEIDVPKIKAGQKATIALDAFADKTFVGKLSNIDSIGTITSGVVSYTAYITLLDAPSDIKSGMTASVTIQTDRKDDVIKIPTSAITTTNGTSTVQVMKNGKITIIPVELGIASDTETEVTSGLTQGDTIITSAITPSTTSAGTSTSPFSGLGGRGGFGASGGNTVIRRGN